jgi:PleD family two-component response regulator
VSDTGRGMTKAVMARIFAPFFTTRRTGNGLGLATGCEIVREHGGAIDVRSTPGLGSCFEVWLPCSSASDQLTPEYSAAMRHLGHGETVLVIDDDRDRLLREEEMLAALGYEPVGFANPDNALAACRTAPQRFDAFLVGYLLSTASALALAAALHEIAPDRPILLATASSGEIGANALIAAGISEIVRWPLVASEMAATLTQCFASPSQRSANSKTQIRSSEISA